LRFSIRRKEQFAAQQVEIANRPDCGWEWVVEDVGGLATRGEDFVSLSGVILDRL